MAKEPLFPHVPRKGEPFHSENMEYRDEQDAVKLINQALSEISSNHLDSAVWRLVDATGIIARIAPAGRGLIGRDQPTGRGYKITSSQGIWGGGG